tara:strand:- start:207 stop:503 length:297 start_codon:yes stop_codon:yes gene_type:complete
MKAKKLKEKVNELLIEWVRSVVNEDEREQVTENNIKDLLPKHDYLQLKKTWYLSMYTHRWTKQSIKKLLRKGYTIDNISMKDLENLSKVNLSKGSAIL